MNITRAGTTVIIVHPISRTGTILTAGITTDTGGPTIRSAGGMVTIIGGIRPIEIPIIAARTAGRFPVDMPFPLLSSSRASF